MDHDETEKEILQLVNQADGRDRAMLLIIYRMHRELISNTVITRQVAEAMERHSQILTAHAEEEMTLINQFKGGWKTATWGFGIIGALVTLLLSGAQWFALREMTMMQTQIAVNTARLYVIERDNELQKEQISTLKQLYNSYRSNP